MSNPFDFLDPVQPQAQGGATSNPFDFLDPVETNLPNPAPLPPPRPTAEEQTAIEMQGAPLPPPRPKDILEQLGLMPQDTLELPREEGPEQLADNGQPFHPMKETLRLKDAGGIMGDDRSALTLEDQAATVKGRLESADTGVAEAQDRFRAAKERLEAVTGKLGGREPRKGSQTALQLGIAQEEFNREQRNLADATDAKVAALKAAPPTLNATASMGRSGLKGIASIGTGTLDSLAILTDAATAHPGGGTNLQAKTKAIADSVGHAIKNDPARAGEFLDQFGQGVGSAVGFMVGGLATKSLKMSAGVGSSVLGGLQNASEKYREAEQLGKKGFDLALNFVAGGATGATEGVLGVGKLADLERVTKGGVSRYFAVVGKEMGEEAFQEATQQLLNNMQDRGLLGKDTPIEEGVGMNALIGALIGGGMASHHHLFNELATKLGADRTDPHLAPPGAAETVDPDEFLRRTDRYAPTPSDTPGADAFTRAAARSVLDDTRLLPAPGGEPAPDGSDGAPAPAPAPAGPAIDPGTAPGATAPADVQPGAAPGDGGVASATPPDAGTGADSGPLPASAEQPALTAKEEADLRLLLGHGYEADEIADMNRGERVQAIMEAQRAGSKPWEGPLPGETVSHETPDPALPPLPEDAVGGHDLTPRPGTTGAAPESGPTVESGSMPSAAKPSAPTPSQDVDKTPPATAELQAGQEPISAEKPQDPASAPVDKPVSSPFPPTLAGLREQLPKDENGNPDFEGLHASMEAATGSKIPWGKATPEQKQAAWDHLNGHAATNPTTRDESAGQAESVSKKPLKDLPTDILAAITNGIYDSPSHPETGAVRVTMTDAERDALREHGIEVSDTGVLPFESVAALQAERDRHTGADGKKPKTPANVKEAAEGLASVFGTTGQAGASDPSSGVASTGATETAPGANSTAPAKKPKVRVHTAKNRQPKTLLEHIMKAGGLVDMGGELRARDLHTHFRPGWGRLVRKNGMSLDKGREHATELGYLQPHQTIDDFLDLIEDEARGRKAKTLAEQNYDDESEQDPEEAHRDASDAIVEYLREIGLPHDEIESEALSLAADLLLHGSDIADAYADAVRQLEQRDPEVASEMEANDIPFDPVKDDDFAPDADFNDWLSGGSNGADPEAQGGASESDRPAGGTKSPATGERPATDSAGQAQDDVAEGPARPERESADGQSTERDSEELDQRLLNGLYAAEQNNGVVQNADIRKRLVDEGYAKGGTKLKLTDKGKAALAADRKKRAEAKHDPLADAIIGEGLVGNDFLLDLNKTVGEGLFGDYPSRLFGFPVEYVSRERLNHGAKMQGLPETHETGALWARHPKFVGTDAALDLEAKTGFPVEWSETDEFGRDRLPHGEWWHAIDMANDAHLPKLLESLEYTSPDAVAKGLDYNTHYGKISPANFRKLAAAVDLAEPSVADSIQLMFDHMSLSPRTTDTKTGKKKTGPVTSYNINFHLPPGMKDSSAASAWTWLHGFENGFLKRDRSGHPQPTQKLLDLKSGDLDLDEAKGAAKPAPATENTIDNVPGQTLIDGVKPVTDGEKIGVKADKPLKAKKPQKDLQADGLFGDSHTQGDLLDGAPEQKKPEPETDAGERLKQLEEQLVVFASGMSRPTDAAAGGRAVGGLASRGVGFEINELSNATMKNIARSVVVHQAQVFVDSGAFGVFKKNMKNKAAAEKEAMDLFGEDKPATWIALDFDEIFAKYDKLLEMIGEQYDEEGEPDYPKPLLVMPDVVGDQAASLELVEQYAERIKIESDFNLSKPIVPIQKGKLSMAEAYDQVVATLGTDNFIVGIPSNAAALSDMELIDFLTAAKPRGIHFLGAAAKSRLDARLRAIATAGVDLEHLSADGNILRGSLYGQQDTSGDKRPGAVTDALIDKSPEVFDGDLTGHFAERLIAGKIKNIAEARKIAREYGVTDVKAVEEALELAIVTAARRIVSKNGTPEYKFDRLHQLYVHQPNLSTRTSTSMLNQAYSTPIPLAYVASRLAGITQNTTVLEPTAGNGALLIEATPTLTVANEINDARRANLAKQGFPVSDKNAGDEGFTGAMLALADGGFKFDRLITNPPFGTVKDDIGESTVFDLTDIQRNYRTREIDHAIVLRSLEAMKDTGRAVLIIGSVNPQRDRSDGYRGKAKNEFFLTLLKNYNVVDHFTVDGDLYKKQGAGWPVDVIVIEGRGESKLDHPAKTVPPVLSSWDEVKAKLHGVQQSEAGGSSEIAGDADGSGRGGPAGDDAGPRDGNGGSGPLAVQPESGQPEGVRADGDTGQSGPDTGRAGVGKRGKRGNTAGTDSSSQPALSAEEAVDAAIDELFAEKKTVEKPSTTGYVATPGYAVPKPGSSKLEQAVHHAAVNINDAADFALGRQGMSANMDAAKRWYRGAKAAWDRGVAEHGEDFLEVARDVGKLLNQVEKAMGIEVTAIPRRKPAPARKVAAGVQEAAEGLFTLFGKDGSKLNSGFTFDEDTYAKAKPFFKKAIEHLKDAAADIMQLARDLVGYMRDSMGATKELIDRMKPYLVRFIQQVQDGSIFREEAKAQEKASAEPIRDLTETEGQLTYKPRSGIFGLGTLVPANMKTATENALEALENRVGNLETFVSTELGYEQDKDGPYFMRDGQKERPFAAEQIDALALAIDNMNKGAALIIGDQTGIGKGRVNAGIIRYALEKKAHPIFVTKDNGLYKDIYRDLTDIGIQEYLGREPKFLMTDANQSFPLDENGRITLKSASVAKHNALLLDLGAAGSLGEYDIVLTSYSQMQTVNGGRTDRMRFLQAIAPNAIMALDESHNAGGQANKRDDYESKLAKWEKARSKAIRAGKPFNRPQPERDVPDRAGFSRQMIDAAKAAFYSSATYAKRPDVMDLYRKTDMRLAVKDISELAEAIQHGGIPMQQVVAAMLAQAGQYVRRERSFAGVSYDPAVVPVDEEVYDNFSTALARIQEFAKAVAAATAEIDAELTGSGESVGHDNATGDAGASSLNFTSIMHNLINNMLLAINAKPAAEAAIEAVKRGEKPLIAVAQTAESFLSAYADENDLKVGDTIDLDMGKMLERYLERSRWITIRQPFMDAGDEAEKVRLTDEQLGEEGLAAWEAAKEHLRTTDFSALPASPIDYIKSELKKAGVRVGEITGRTLTIEYLNGKQKLVNRAGSERSTAGKTETIKQFNSAGLDALILNQSGSTGLSMHASAKFKDQSKRIMIIAQPEQNIDTHFQMLGRIHRTGQVKLPAYIQLIPDIPAAKRPAAILMKKMASLNANTTASRKSALTTDNVPDFMNEFGDRVAANILRDDPELADRLDVNPPRTDGGASALDGAMRKVTGRIPLLPIDMQKELYERIESEYAFLLEQMESEGRNTLEAKTLELDARPVRSSVSHEAEGPSPFQQAVTLTEYDIKRQGKPYTIEELHADMAKHLGVSLEYLPGTLAQAINRMAEIGRDQVATMNEEAQEGWQKFRERFLGRITDETKIEAQRTRLDGIANDHAALTEYLFPGNRIRLKYDDQESITGIVLRVTPAPEKATNPLAPGQWKVKIAVPSGERSREYPFTKFVMGREPETGEIALEQAGWSEPVEATVRMFELAATMDDRETRVIVTGNLLKGFVHHHGSIINFRTQDGKIVPGIMLRDRRGASLEAAIGNVRTEISIPVLLKALTENVGTPYVTEDGYLTLTNNGYGRIMMNANKARDKGGKYTLNRSVIAAVGEDFYSRGGHMRADARIEKLPAVLQALSDAGATFTQAAELNITEHKDGDQADYASIGRAGFSNDGSGLYSSVLKAVEKAKTKKASGQQWLATIRNSPGVKAEELAWLGLEDWLADNRTEQFTRADLFEFIRENQLKIEHIEKRDATEEMIQAKAQELYEEDLNEAVEDLEERNADDLVYHTADVFEEDGGWYYEISGQRDWDFYDTAEEAQEAGNTEADRLNEMGANDLRTTAANRMDSWSVYEQKAQVYYEEEFDGRTRYRPYKTPGAEESYREHLLTLETPMVPVTFSARQNTNDREFPWSVINNVHGNAVVHVDTQAEAEKLAATYTSESKKEGLHEQQGVYRSGHWGEQNVLAHFRTTERTIDGKKTLLVEEIQSDWHQEGRKKGYGIQSRTSVTWQLYDDMARLMGSYGSESDAIEAKARFHGMKPVWAREPLDSTNWRISSVETIMSRTGVPEAPFKTTWHELALKRILKMAVDGGFDQVAWTSGDLQNARYGLEKHFEKIELIADDGYGHRIIQAYDWNNRIAVTEYADSDARVIEVLGESLGRRLLDQPEDPQGWDMSAGRSIPAKRVLKGNDLRYGGDGMRGFYDRMLPASADKIGKRFGTKTARFGGKVQMVAPEWYVADNRGNAQSGLMTDRQKAEQLAAEMTERHGVDHTVWTGRHGVDEFVHILPIPPDMKLGITVDGLPLYDARGRQVSPEEKLRVRNEVIAAIHAAIVGEHAGLEFPDRIVIQDAVGAKNSGAKEGQKEALAVYANHIIKISAKGNFVNIFHEAAHVFQRLGAYTEQEIALLNKERERNRKKVGEAFDVDPETLAAMPDYEIDAYAAEDFAYHVYRNNPAGMRGYHIGLRRAWQRMVEMVRRIMNAFRGLGYQITEDIFAAQMRGDMKARLDARARGENVAGFGYGRSWEADKARYAAENPESRDDYATRQRGTFTDDTIADVARRNRANGLAPTPPTGTPPSFDKPDHTGFDTWRVATQDTFQQLAKIQGAIEEARAVLIPDPLNAYQAQSLFPGRRDEALEDFKRDHVDPIVKAIHDAKLTTDEVGLYLIAKHAAERNQLMAERDPKRFGTDGGSGMADQTATDYLDEFVINGKQPALERVAQMVYAVIAFDRDNRYNNGLISDETLDHWTNLFPSGNYVPLTGAAERDEDGPETHYGRGFDIRGREAHQAHGRMSLSDNPLAAAIYMATEGIVRVEKNRVGKHILRLAKANPNEDVWHIVRNPTTKVLREDPKRPGVMLSVTVPNNLERMKDNVLGVKVGGVPWFIEFKDQSLAFAFKNMGALQFGPIAQKISWLMRGYAQLQTGRNPEFFIRNGLRDFQEAIAYGFSISNAFGARVIKNAIPALGASLRYAFGLSAGSKWDPIIEEWRRNGGKINGFSFKDIDAVQQEIQQELNDLAAGTIKRWSKKVLRFFVKIIDGLNEGIENANRLSLFKAARESGMSTDKAAFHARNGTINFTKKGRWSPWLNISWVFFNASTQGAYKHAEMLARSKKMRAVWGALIGVGYLMAELARSFGDDDEEGRRPYDNVAEFVKRKNFIIPYGVKKDRFGNQHLQYFQIPMMFGFNIPFYFGGQIADVVQGRTSGFKAAVNSLGAVIDGFNPLGSGNLIQMMSPTLARPIVEQLQNRDWRDRPIHPEEERWNEGLPKSSQATNSSTNPMATRFTQELNRLTGGTKYEPGLIDIYPGQVQHGVEWIGGGLGRFVVNGIQTIMEGQETPLEKMPLIRQFMGETTGAGESQRYYEVKQEDQKNRNVFSNAKKALKENPNDEDAAKAVGHASDALDVDPRPDKKTKWKDSASGVFTATDKDLKVLRQDKLAIQNDRSLTTMEKLRRTQDIDARIQALQRDARGAYRSKLGRKPSALVPSGVEEPETGDDGIEEAGMWESISDFVTGGPKTKTLPTEKPTGYPTREDAEQARKAGFGYGRDQKAIDGDELNVAGRTDKVTQPPAKKGAKPTVLDAFRATGLEDTARKSDLVRKAITPGQSKRMATEDPVMRDGLTQGALAVNRSAIATLGFDPQRTAFDIKSGATDVAGMYSARDKDDKPVDAIWVNGRYPFELPHESLHRGLEKVRQDRPDLFKGFDVDEETIVRQIMRTTMGNPEKGEGDIADKQLERSRYLFEESLYESSYNKRLAAIEAHAAEMIRRDRPRGGPR